MILPSVTSGMDHSRIVDHYGPHNMVAPTTTCHAQLLLGENRRLQFQVELSTPLPSQRHVRVANKH